MSVPRYRLAGSLTSRLNPSFFALADRYPSSAEEEDDANEDETEEEEEFSFVLPKTGTDFLLGPNPVHLNSLSAIPEVVYNVDPTITSRMMLQDSARLSGKRPYHKVVYDCFGVGHGDEHFDEESLFRFLETNPIPLNLGTNCQRQNLPKVTSMVNSDTLLFESRFESGNLRRAVQVYDYEYDLILKFDVETNGHTQWFYFSIQNAKRGRKYKFNIVNYLKQDSLYNHGMLPLFYSTNDALTKGQGWIRSGTDICYYRNNIKRKGASYYTLTFTFEVAHDNDVCYFAYSYPYTYSNLQNYLNNLEKDKVRSQYLRRRVLCNDLAGNACDALTITSFAGDPSALKTRKGVVLTARVHPGESNSSWIIKGVIDFLTGSSIESKVLRENFIFKIVPMLNPDGVINGNYRCALSGSDLNRKWHNPNIKTHPTIFHTKKMVVQFQKEREVVLFCDFHGHSRKKNMFMYGCTDSKYGVERLMPKVFPRLLWKISPHFSFKDCHFGKQKGKDTTARVVMHKSGVKNAFTLEASFCGPDTGIHMGRQFTCKHFEQMGHYFCQGILEFCNPEQTQVNLIIKELDLLFPEKSKDEDSTRENGKAISKLLKGFATQQVRNKTINLNYRGKSSLRDGLSGSTIEVGTPVNDSMSVSVWSKGYTRCLQINRPRESNRITSEVARDLLHQFKVMDTNPIINLITLSGIGNGFLSAGYDFRELQTLMDKGDLETVYSLVRDTHKLAYYAANCETPTMTVINGLMLGPGTSLGTSANYVIATPGSLFSAADAAYGYFPDCGVTMLLSRVNQKYEGLGTFLGLTGAQLKSSDLVNCGIATSFGMESVSQYIAERLLEVQTGANQDDIHNCIVESTESDVPTLSFAFELYKIKEHFSNKKSVEEIIQSLKNTITDSAKTKPERDWAANILENMNQMSPLSLKVIFRGIKECDQGLGLDETYQRDYRIASRLIKSKDFKQGLNSVLTGIEPVWEFESVEQVPDSVVDSLFAPLSFEKDVDCELQLPEEVFLEDQILFQIKKKQSVQVAKQ